jgi:putative flippase GtrA
MGKNNVFRRLILSQFLRYVFLAGLATLVDWSAFALGIYRLNLHYLPSVILAFSLGSFFNFILNKYLNFKNSYKKLHLQFGAFLTVALIGLLPTIALMYLLIDFLLLPQLLSRIITTGIVLFYSFFGHKYITFGLLK